MSEYGVWICENCVGEPYLSRIISESTQECSCSYCSSIGPTLAFDELAEIVFAAIETHFYLTPEEPSSFEYSMMKHSDTYDWFREGMPLVELLEDIVSVDNKIASELQECLSDKYSNYDYQTEENPFGIEAHYEEAPADQESASDLWNLFCNEITKSSRFFSQKALSALNDLLGNINSLRTHGGKPVVTRLKKNRSFYRARIAKSQKDLKRILKSPVNELGAPPFRYARSGRMNSHGISMFYGASNVKTCIAEVRPPVGSQVVIGKFALNKSLRILDLNLLSSVIVKGSYFDPESNDNWGRVAFLRRIEERLTKPVMPEDTDFEYLPTQVIAEYLCKKLNPKVDGILFESSQVSGKGKNIVLFNHASETEPYELPEGYEVSIGFGFHTEDEYDDSINIIEEVSEVDNTDKDTQSSDNIFEPWNSISESNNSEFSGLTKLDDQCTLKLDVNGISVLRIGGVKYQTEDRYTSRYRFEDKEDNLF